MKELYRRRPSLTRSAGSAYVYAAGGIVVKKEVSNTATCSGRHVMHEIRQQQQRQCECTLLAGWMHEAASATRLRAGKHGCGCFDALQVRWVVQRGKRRGSLYRCQHAVIYEPRRRDVTPVHNLRMR